MFPSTPLRPAAGAGADVGVDVGVELVEGVPGNLSGQLIPVRPCRVAQHAEAHHEQQEFSRASQSHTISFHTCTSIVLTRWFRHYAILMNALRESRRAAAFVPLTTDITALAVSAPDCAAPFMYPWKS